MPMIEFQNVRKAYGQHVVVPDFSLVIPSGAFVVMLGPSGCGKSTVLRMLAGLEPVSAGRILVDGREVQSLAPSQRGCAMVFQNYALYPHMTVADNMGYAMRLAGASSRQRRERVQEVARMLGLEALLERRPSQLSGGQRQRVAIGRAIAREPAVLLFDEPLSNLDAQLRGETRMELAALHRRIQATSLFVTHDQVEAMTLADVIVVMKGGCIEQVGHPEQIYGRPDSAFVAQFVGSPPMNLVEATADAGCVRAGADGWPVGRLAGRTGPLQLGLRPESVRVGDDGALPGRILGVERHGREQVLYLDTPLGRLVSVQPESGLPHGVGQAVRLHLDWHQAHAFECPPAERCIAGFVPGPPDSGG